MYSKFDGKEVLGMPDDLKIYGIRNEMILCEAKDSENQARNDTPIYQTSIIRYNEPGIDSSKRPEINTPNTI